MASSLIRQIAFSLLCFCSLPANSDDESELPAFAFGWSNNDDTFDAGETATIKVIVLGNFDFAKHDFRFNPNVSVNDKVGNSCFVSGMALHLDGATETWSITFIPIMVGLFNVLVVDQHFRVLDSSLHFHVNPGRMYPAAGVVSWKDDRNEVTAGTRVELLILPKDAFGNNISSSSSQESVDQDDFTLFASTSEGLPANLTDIANKGRNGRGYLNLEFTAVTAGILLLHVQIQNQTLQGSPLPFKVNPGKLDIQRCVAEWNVETKYFQLSSLMEGFINQHDLYLNRVPGFYDFDVQVVERGSNLSLPVSDLVLGEVSATGILSFSLTLYEPGNFTLLISDREKRNLVSGTPFDFTVYVGYCDGEMSIVNGSGLDDSVAGEAAVVYVFLKDAYLYPSPVELESLKLEVEHESGRTIDHYSIIIIQVKWGNGSGGGVKYDSTAADFAPAPLIEPRRQRGSDFAVVFVPEKSGSYEIRVFCGNVLLSPTHPFHKKVTPGEVNLSLSGVVDFDGRVAKLTENDVTVRLQDSFLNPVPKQQAKLELAIGSVNGSGSVVSSSSFSDNHDGSYTATYAAEEVGTYEVCASYGGHGFSPCPFGVNVYRGEYFPKAYNDAISVWEDESVAFDVLENDYFGGTSNASIVEYSKPGHGSLLLSSEGLFRYTPYERFYGKDWFSYTISDVNGNAASGSVDLLIICRPPQFVSIPTGLRAVENAVSPRYRGFSGFRVLYSDPEESIAVSLASPSGTVMLSPMQMQFWNAKWDEFSVEDHAAEGGRELTLVGCLDVINYALRSVRYLGKENFYGNDVIRVSATNKNGRNDVDVPVDVLAVNDFPIINVPLAVVLDDDMKQGAAIFGQVSGNFDCIHDPDLAHFPGNRSDFSIFVSMEVSDGVLSTSLPSELINTTEVKLKSSHLWQPVQTFVAISKHFSVKAKGIRFRGSIDECNNAVKRLSYHEGKHGAALRLTVNDLGNHGCYPDCGQTTMSASLVAEKTVNLIQNNRQTSSSLAHTLRSVVAIESAAVFLLAVLLLIFMCRCAAILVVRDKKPTPAIQLQQSSKGKENTEEHNTPHE